MIRESSDAGISSILGFIVGMVLLTGSLAAVVYFVGTAPETGTTEESRELESQVIRVVNTLATTEGQPANWTELRPVTGDELRSVGLLANGSTIASLEKARYLQNGTIDGERLLESYNLKASGYQLDADARVVPVPVLEAPPSRTYAVAEASSVVGSEAGNGIDFIQSPRTKDGIARFEETNRDYDFEEHQFRFRLDEHPETTGIAPGNTHPDDPWFIETQLIPQMAGLTGTYSLPDRSPTSNDPVVYEDDPVRAYRNGENELVRWHVITEDAPHPIPGNGYDGNHVATTNYRMNTGSDAGGIGLWRTTDGWESVNLLGGFRMPRASGATLEFDHILNTNHEEESGQWEECYNLEIETECVRVRPAIAFWNTTAATDQWTRLTDEPKNCPAGAGWNHTGDAEATGGSWTHRSVDLCEAVKHSSGTVWLALWWRTACIDATGIEDDCESLDHDPKKVTRGWFVDNLNLTTDSGEVHLDTGLEPLRSGERETLFVSNGVDYSLHEPVADGIEQNVYEYIRRFVEKGGNVVAYTPGTSGAWLGEVGLEAVDRGSTTQNVKTRVPSHLVMSMPHELPTETDKWAAEPVAWSSENSPDTPGGGTPSGFSALTTVQSTTKANPNATLLAGDPYGRTGGHVSAVAYDISDFNDTELLKKLLKNVYASVVLEDPTFDVQGVEVPESGSIPVETSQRVVLVEASEDGSYQVPMEVTIYLWPTQLG